MQENNITTLVQLQEVVAEIKNRYWTTNGEIKLTERQLHKKNELIDQTEKYLKYRPFQQKYAQTKPKQQDAYFDKYRAKLTLYDAAQNYLKRTLGKDTALKPKTWQSEAAALSVEKDRLYSEVRKLKAEVQEAEAVKKCVEQVLQPERTQAKRRDMEL